MKSYKRTVVVTIPPGITLDRVLSMIMEAVQAQFVSYKIKGNKVIVNLRGDPVSVERSVGLLKRVLRDIALQARMEREGLTIIPKGESSKILGVPVPLDALKTLLSLRGIRVVEENDTVVVQEKLDVVKNIAIELYSKMEEAREFARGKAREVAAIVSLQTGVSVEEVVDRGVKIGAFKLRDNRAVIAMEKTALVKQLIDALSRGEKFEPK